MKLIIALIGFTMILSTVALGQVASDSTRSRGRQQSRRVIDQDGDGINDQTLGTQKRLRQGMDRFIDANGDGISDSRECGLGFRRGRMQQTELGKQSMGKGQKGK
jgi:hypothetical protein